MTASEWAWKHWQRRGLVARTLWPVSILYRTAARWHAGWHRRRNAGSERVRSAVVIVVGNRTVGGSGKTPMTAWIASLLAAQGYPVGIVTRGYGRADSAFRGRVDVDADPYRVGDEPVLLARRSGVPVQVDADRVRGVEALVDLGCRVIVSDDGLQHHRLQADLRVLMIDGDRRFGNGWCLPAGPLREPLESALPADFTLCLGGIPKAGEIPVGMRGSEQLVAVDGSGVMLPLAELRGREVHAVAGIANPERFFAGLEAAGISPVRHAFPDHHAFRPSDLEFADPRPVLMTEKDAVKCEHLAGPGQWYQTVEVCPGADFGARLQSRVQALLHAKTLENT